MENIFWKPTFWKQTWKRHDVHQGRYWGDGKTWKYKMSKCKNGITATLRLSRVREKGCASMASTESLAQISQLIIAKTLAVQHPYLNWSWLWADHGSFFFQEDCLFWGGDCSSHSITTFNMFLTTPLQAKNIWHWTWTSILFKRTISFQNFCSGVSYSISPILCLFKYVRVARGPLLHVRLLAAQLHCSISIDAFGQ